jgi:nucleotide-binding universal stress UspA family protein
MKILLAADGSEFTRRAASYVASHVAELAEPPEIHLLNVHAPIPIPRAAAVVGSEAVNRYHEEECAAALSVAERVFKAAGVVYQSSWVLGKPGEEIASYAAKHGIDVIVMGSHGHGTLRTLALGSVADSVLRLAQCPVTIIR